MAITASDVQSYVNASAADEAFIDTCLFEAAHLVAGYVGAAVIPEVVVDRAVLEVCSELYHRRQAPSGVAQFATPDAAPVRVARDPMVGAYPILNRFVGGGFA